MVDSVNGISACKTTLHRTCIKVTHSLEATMWIRKSVHIGEDKIKYIISKWWCLSMLNAPHFNFSPIDLWRFTSHPQWYVLRQPRNLVHWMCGCCRSPRLHHIPWNYLTPAISRKCHRIHYFITFSKAQLICSFFNK